MGLKLSKRKLGKADLELSVLGLGTVKLGRNTDVKYPEPFIIPNEEETFKLLKKAADFGINYLDTAPSYGNSETKIGKVLAKLDKKFHILSKVGEIYNPYSGSSFNFNLKDMRTSIEKSIENLQVKCLDVVLLHLGEDEIQQIKSGAIENLINIKNEGLINYIGISGKSFDSGKMALDIGVDVLMITYNPEYYEEYSLIDMAEKKGAGIIIKKAFGSGHLIKNKETVKFILSNYLKNENITSIVVGTKNIIHLEENFNSVEMKYLERNKNV